MFPILFLKKIIINPIRAFKRFFDNNKYKREISKLYKNNFIWSAQIGYVDDIGVKKGIAMADTIVNSINYAFNTHLNTNLKKSDSIYFNIFPGEHYRLLSGLIQHFKPKTLVDIGTSTGMSSRVMLDYSFPKSKVITFDLIKWDKFDSHLEKSDFRDGRLTQYLEDLSNTEIFKKHLPIINEADLIFLDAPKDGIFEYLFIKNLVESDLIHKPRYLILDDIKFLNMVKLWRSIRSPKFDLTSFGHATGTGIIDISSKLEIDPVAFV